MKLIPSKIYLKINLMIASLMCAFMSVAQDTKKVDIDINTSGSNESFFMQPWVWVVGSLLFILLLVALLRGGGNK